MNEQQLKQLLTNEVNNSAPDKDALWEKIEGRLAAKNPMQQSEPPKKKPLRLAAKIGGAIAACIAVVIAVPLMFGSGGVSSDSAANELTDGMNAVQEDAAQNTEDNIAGAPSDAPNGAVTVKPKAFMSYNELPFASYSETIIQCSGEPSGGYFVEEEILSETDALVRAEITKVYLSGDGESICYDLSVSEGYGASVDEVTVHSCSRYPMKRGREYLLALTETEDGYITAFDGVPQPEFDSLGGLVFYNGWQSLITEDCYPLEYPKAGEEEYFHDRMMYSPSGDYSAVITRWLDMKG